ncbi:NAD-dependent protein deacylase [Anaerotruncus sp. AF02-27]|uniref:NAD-dependent protein deacylase n=1 Tax=Anaerotruncus sp. AF02-27 TaxID=2292191 RepID=UPI000E47A6FA|nr:NAD-dependent protein deacylase [Anaerotruncus sp. AF02-27]RGX56916.1 NAD-dependent protein deacylase [Anaerotruncus sp. AF02-27]
MREAEALQALIDESRHIVFFGGAGVSTESGIPDFRSVDGLYRQRWKYPPERMISHRFFVHNTAEFFEFYRAKMLCLDAKPNAAHKKLAEMEGAGRLDAVITQNIDGLHQAAGSKVVYELHGSVHRNHCTACGKFYDAHFIKECTGVPRCTCGGLVKPDVVLYEEPLDSDTVGRAVRALERTDLLIIAGTSLAVYPAAGLIDYCRGKIVLINRSATPMDSRADLLIAGSVGEVMARIRV